MSALAATLRPRSCSGRSRGDCFSSCVRTHFLGERSEDPPVVLFWTDRLAKLDACALAALTGEKLASEFRALLAFADGHKWSEMFRRMNTGDSVDNEWKVFGNMHAIR